MTEIHKLVCDECGKVYNPRNKKNKKFPSLKDILIKNEVSAISITQLLNDLYVWRKRRYGRN